MAEEGEDLQQTLWAVFNLLMNLGLVHSVLGEYPEDVQEGFYERLSLIRRWAEQQIEEIQMFGEAYD